MITDLLNQVQDYVIGMLTKELPVNLTFHNLAHTRQVVVAATEIGVQSGLPREEMLIVQTAAWFHDCGYTKVYIGHEGESVKMAIGFLEEQACKKEFIEAVCKCIAATQFPNHPESLMEEVLCDADFYHLTRPNYPEYERAIRNEFKIFLGLSYSDEEWRASNCITLMNHHYFTEYGRAVLRKFKDLNLQLLGCKNS